jgi:hypothetical protein
MCNVTNRIPLWQDEVEGEGQEAEVINPTSLTLQGGYVLLGAEPETERVD